MHFFLGPPLTEMDSFHLQGETLEDTMFIFTDPDTLPPGKMVKITIVAIFGHADIVNTFTPSQSGGEFMTQFKTEVGPDVPPGIYQYEIQIDCHINDTDTNVTKIPYFVWVGMCPAQNPLGFHISGNGTPVPGPRPSTVFIG